MDNRSFDPKITFNTFDWRPQGAFIGGSWSLLIKMIEILENITFRRFKRYNIGNLKNIIVGNEYKWMIEKI